MSWKLLADFMPLESLLMRLTVYPPKNKGLVEFRMAQRNSEHTGYRMDVMLRFVDHHGSYASLLFTGLAMAAKIRSALSSCYFVSWPKFSSFFLFSTFSSHTECQYANSWRNTKKNQVSDSLYLKNLRYFRVTLDEIKR